MAEFARPLQAEIYKESRGARRRTLVLATDIESPETNAKALIHDLSESGLRIQTNAGLITGESLFVELPFIGSTETRIVWQDGTYFGCEFLTPISRGTVSAALLRSTVDRTGDEPQTVVEELPVGIKPSLEEMMTWEFEFERTKGANGYQLIGFRQTSDGMIIAMVAKEN